MKKQKARGAAIGVRVHALVMEGLRLDIWFQITRQDYSRFMGLPWQPLSVTTNRQVQQCLTDPTASLEMLCGGMTR